IGEENQITGEAIRGIAVALNQPVVPDVVGIPEPNAVASIEAVENLAVGEITQQHSDTVPAGLIISQAIVAGTVVPIGSSVDLVVSLGQPSVPDVVGMAEPNAAAAITAVDNLLVGAVVSEYNDTVAATVVIRQSPAGGTIVFVGSSVDLVVSLGQPAVPDVLGMTEPNAILAITAVDSLTVGDVTYDYNDTVPSGLVVSVIPAVGTLVPIGSSVNLVVSLGQPKVPNVEGMTEPNAISAITGVDSLTVGNVIYEHNDTVPLGLVIRQNPAAGTSVPIASTVDIVVSGALVPDTVDTTLSDANTALSAAGLSVGNVTDWYSDVIVSGHVMSQNPTGGVAVAPGSSVDLVISLGQPVVPNVVGMTEPNAAAAFTNVSLAVGTVVYAYDNTVAAGLVISQLPLGGTTVPVGLAVDIRVSLGRPVVPCVVGSPEAEASSAITSITVAQNVVISQNPTCGTEVLIGSTVDLLISLGPPIPVPDVVGMDWSQANPTIHGMGLTVGTVEFEYHDTVLFGSVAIQVPVSGTIVPLGTAIDIVLSLGRPTVPYVLDMTIPEANSTIISIDNLAVGSVAYVYSDTVEVGHVVSQDPVADTEVLLGSTVDLAVSLGQPNVPDIVGMTEANATVAIAAIDNLQVGTVAQNVVISQNPTCGTEVLIGSTVDLLISLGPPIPVP
ncbi:MAG: PASTA domain-containing protein, partial [Planctomycetota bacterium]